jgi:ferredoxin
MKEWSIPEINLLLCTECGSCIELCPTEAVTMGPEGPIISRPADCTYCAECDAVCPEGAIRCPFEIVWLSTTE